MQRARKVIILLLLGFCVFSLVTTLIRHRTYLIQEYILMSDIIGIQDVAIDMRTTPYSFLLVTLIVTIASIPPMLGFSFITSISGFIYGFPHGIMPAALGAFSGALITFSLIRKCNFARFVKLSDSKQETYTAIQESIEQGGFGMMLLIRLCPVPWTITSTLLSLLPSITLAQFISVTGISCFKVSISVWMGSQLADLSNPDLPPATHRVALTAMGCGLVILVILTWWLYRLTMKRVKTLTSKTEDEQFVSVAVEAPSSPSKKEM
ncbi:hypothetical protein K501DRAFT_278007 [Backusella circina FSU 941]|nr:hypothetical protein K501DRAFT_278007 [Backusella circina FSU 941]